jgi:hypothetical protein
MTTDANVTLTVQTAATTPIGQYTITVTASGAQTQTATYSLTVGDTIPTLQNGIAVTNLSGITNSERYYQITVPTGMTIADFSIGGGSGDADLYIQKDTLPDDDNYKCASRGDRTDDWCQIYYGNSEGHWYVRVFGAASYSGVSLQVTFTVGTAVQRKVAHANLSGAAGSQRFYWFNIGDRVRRFTVSISKTKGDADLRVRLLGLPKPFNNVCTKIKLGHHGETCSVRNPYPSTWWIGITGATDYTQLTLLVKY